MAKGKIRDILNGTQNAKTMAIENDIVARMRVPKRRVLPLFFRSPRKKIKIV